MTGRKKKTTEPATGPGKPGGMNILIADSSETFIRYLELLVKRLGYLVHPARTGRECRDVLDKVQIGLILLEDNLPDLGGDELARSIRGDRKTSGIPILLVTGDSRRRGNREPDPKLFVGELKKPINVQSLFKSLQQHFPYPSRRGSARAPIRRKILVDDGHEQRSLLSLSFGEGGVFLETRAPWPVGTALDLFIPLPGQAKPVKVKGQVVYTVCGEGMMQRPGMGISFSGLGKKVRALLLDYLDEFAVEFIP